MQSNSQIATNTFLIPDIIKDKINIIIAFELEETEVILFNLALLAIANEMRKDNLCIEQLTNLNIIFSKNGSFEIVQESDSVFGMHFSFAVYAMETLRKTNNDYFMLVTFIEELTHHYWRIEDEISVKYKVVDIAHSVEPKITLDMLRGWGINGI